MVEAVNGPSAAARLYKFAGLLGLLDSSGENDTVFGAPPGGDPSGEAGPPRAGSPQPTPPAARAAGHIERSVRVAHSSQPRAADSFCAPTAGDAVLPLS